MRNGKFVKALPCNSPIESELYCQFDFFSKKIVLFISVLLQAKQQLFRPAVFPVTLSIDLSSLFVGSNRSSFQAPLPAAAFLRIKLYRSPGETGAFQVEGCTLHVVEAGRAEPLPPPKGGGKARTAEGFRKVLSKR
jgi:hypothetical protein